MTPIEQIKEESKQLYTDIDSCITDLIAARTSKDRGAEGKALFRMEGLMVSTLQHLACIMESSESIGQLDVLPTSARQSEDLEREIDDYCREKCHSILLNENLRSKDKTRAIARHFYELGKQAQKEKMHPIRVVPEDAWEISDGRVFAPKLKIVDDGCEEAILVRGFNEEFTIYKED